MILYFLAPKKRPDSHGSARWAEYKDILKMDLISGSGVVVGLYDSGMKKAFTNILRSLENIKKEKYAYAEMDFDAKRGKKLDALREKNSKSCNISLIIQIPAVKLLKIFPNSLPKTVKND